MDSDMTKIAPGRRTKERRKNDSVAWVLGAGIPQDRRSRGDRRRSQK